MINETKLELILLNYLSDQINSNAAKIEWGNEIYDVHLMRERWEELMKQFLEPYKITE